MILKHPCMGFKNDKRFMNPKLEINSLLPGSELVMGGCSGCSFKKNERRANRFPVYLLFLWIRREITTARPRTPIISGIESSGSVVVGVVVVLVTGSPTLR